MFLLGCLSSFKRGLFGLKTCDQVSVFVLAAVGGLTVTDDLALFLYFVRGVIHAGLF